MLIWLGFLVCTALIVYSGTKLSKYGDIIAEKTGLGRTWVGVVIVASVTSLPELVTGISSVTFAGVPEIAVGDVLGACVFNLLVLAVLDAFHRRMPISTRAHQGQILAAGFGILLFGMAAMSLLISPSIVPFGWIGPYSLLSILIYLIAMKVVYSYEKRNISSFIKERAIELKYKDIPIKTAVLHFGVNAAVIIAAAVFLPKIGEGIAEITGLGQAFVGTIFIALSTTLPELTVSVSAVRMDAVDLAAGNLFGSNIFNLLILAIDDFFFVRGPILSFVSPDHAITALSAVLMSAVAVIGLIYRSEKKRLFLAWDSISIALIYFANMLLLYTVR